MATVLVPNISQTPVTATDGTSYVAGNEYWCGVSTTAPSGTLTVEWNDYDWSDPVPEMPASSFTMTRKARWAAMGGTSEPAQKKVNFVNNDYNVVLGWLLTNTDGTWGGHLHWYNTTGKDNVFKLDEKTSKVELTSNTACTKGLTWSDTKVDPVPVVTLERSVPFTLTSFDESVLWYPGIEIDFSSGQRLAFENMSGGSTLVRASDDRAPRPAPTSAKEAAATRE